MGKAGEELAGEELTGDIFGVFRNQRHGHQRGSW